MKIREPNVKILMQELEELEKMIPPLKRSCKDWVQYEQHYNGYDRQWYRDRFIKKLLNFRSQVGELYDTMSERGFR